MLTFSSQSPCTAAFNDSQSYNLTWNNTLRKWQLNRTFASVGTYSYNITCEKGGYETQIRSSEITVGQDTEPPNVTLLWPENNSLLYGGNAINFTYNVTDNTVFISNCSLIINGTVVSTDTTITLNTSQTFSYSLANGNYNWTINCTNINGFEGTGGTFNLTVINTPPSVTINYPPNETIIYGQDYVLLNFTLNDTENDTLLYNVYVAYNDPNGRYELVYNGTDASNTVYTYNLTGAVATNITGPATEIQPDKSAVLLFHFNNDSAYGENDTLVYDFSGNGNNGTCSGSNCPVFNLSAGKFGGAFEFDGSDDYIDAGNPPEMASIKSGTVIAWFKVDDVSDDRTILSYYDGTTTEGWSLLVTTENKVRIITKDNDVHVLSFITNQTIDLNKWYFVAYVVKEDGNILYLNGLPQAVTYSAGNSTTSIFLGDLSLLKFAVGYKYNNNPTYYDYFNGTIDEIAVYNRSLSAEEIYNLYKLKKGKYYWFVNATDYAESSSSGLYWFELANKTLCYNCSDCSEKIQSANAGDVIYLAADIIDHNGNCISFNGKDDVTFDCSGHTISGDGDAYGYGIWLNDSGSGSNNNTIKNCANVSYFSSGLRIDSSDNNTITNITASNNQYYGLYLRSSDNNTITNITANYNQWRGLHIYDSTNNILTNITITTTGNQGGLYAYGGSSYRNDIDHGYYKPCPDNQILDYNDTYAQVAFVTCNNVTLKNSTFIDSVYLFQTHNSNIYNINSSYNYYGLYLRSSDNNALTSITANNNQEEGLYFWYSDNNALTSITANNNQEGGLYLGVSNNNTLTNITANNNWDDGIWFESSDNNTLTSITASNNQDYGIRIYSNSDYNNITSSRIENNTYAGIYLDESDSSDPEYNLIYNNYLNNTLNLLIDPGITGENYLNTTQQSATNIISGNYIGGNYWAKPDGTGFSENCTDNVAPLGICDDYYNLTNGTSVAIDWLPLTSGDTTPPLIGFESPTPPNDTTTTNTSIPINVSITESSLDEFKWNWNGTNYTLFNDSLILMYNFDNVSALGECTIRNQAGCVKDLSGNGNNGILGNGTAGTDPTWISSGKYNGAFSFDEENDFINTTDFSYGPDFTISFWFNQAENTGSSYQYPFSHAGFDVVNSVNFLITEASGGSSIFPSSELGVCIRDSDDATCNTGSEGLNSGFSVVDGYWHLALLLVNSSGSYLYVDGQLKDTSGNGGDPINPATDINVGRRSDGESTRYFGGSIDELRIYNRSLSAEEIQELYMSNLRKYDVDKWEFYINQSKNATAGLDDGTYTYQAFAKDEAGNENKTEIREITIQKGSYTCSNCSDCSDAILNSSSGDIINLVADITGSTTSYCINVSKGNITFDCKGHTIDGDDLADYGIYLYRSADQVTNVTIKNCVLSDWDSANVYLYRAFENTLYNITSTSSPDYGIDIYYADSNNLTNITSNSNNYGIRLYYSGSNTIRDSTLQENSVYDFYIYALDSHCSNEIVNITGSGNRPIEYYNYSVNLSDKTLSELVLCNADGSNITNITIKGSDTLDNNMLFVHRTSNSVFSDINSSFNRIGMLFEPYSDSNTIQDITVNSNYLYGIHLYLSDYNTLTNITANDNGNGIRIQNSAHNLIQNITANSNGIGVKFYKDSDYNNVTYSTIQGSSSAGISLDESGTYDPEYNRIWDNYLNNSGTYGNVWIEVGILNSNYFNTTLDCSKTNILGGSCTGGNYYANSTGTAFSQTCVDDASPFGICDNYYNLSVDATEVIDWLPLTEQTKYVCSDCSDLQAIWNNLSGDYVLVNNINCSGFDYGDGKGFKPIGNSTDGYKFTGTFEGNNYNITGLTINRPGTDYVGLFGYVGSNAVINNTGVLNVNVSGSSNVGGFAGYTAGIISNSYSTGNVKGSLWNIGGFIGRSGGSGIISNSYSTGNVKGSGYRVGGFIGRSDGTISNSYSTGNVSGNDYIGGFVGYKVGTISNSYSTGNVSGNDYIGGFAGLQGGGTISNSYSTGNVKGSGDTVGGFIGRSDGTISNSYTTAQNVSGSFNVGGFIGRSGGTISNSYYNYNQTDIKGRNVLTIGGIYEEDFNTWLSNDKFLDVDNYLTSSGGKYYINNVSDFKSLLIFGQNSSLSFKLNSSLNLENESDFYIPYLSADFNGDGNNISNLNIDLSDISYVGLFGYVTSSAVINNTGLLNMDVKGNDYVGGFIGYGSGTISNSYTTGNVSGNDYVGGFIGYGHIQQEMFQEMIMSEDL